MVNESQKWYNEKNEMEINAMPEQTIQDGLYSIPVKLDMFICRSLGATTIKDLVKNKEISGLTIKEITRANYYRLHRVRTACLDNIPKQMLGKPVVPVKKAQCRNDRRNIRNNVSC